MFRKNRHCYPPLNRKSGLLGPPGLSNDCRTLEAAAEGCHEGARLAAISAHWQCPCRDWTQWSSLEG